MVAKERSKVVEAEVYEVLPGFGLAHLRSADGRVYGLRRGMPGIDFDALRLGQRLRCTVMEPFSRVVEALEIP